MNVAMIRDIGRTSGGHYTLDEAARILGIERARLPTVRNWLKGNQSNAGPVIAREYPQSAGEVGFYDLMELRFVAHFRRQGVSLQSIRRAAAELRRELDVQHPFALFGARFVTDRRRIFALTAEAEGDQRLIDITRRQYVMYDMIEKSLAEGVDFAPSSGLARSWRPAPRRFPDVIVDPRIAHGQPALLRARMPTRPVFDLWVAESGDVAGVATWFDLSPDEVGQAVEYEIDLAA